MPKILGEVRQNGGDFAIVDANNLRGGYMQLETLDELNNLFPDKLKEHMIAHVKETGQLYEYMGDTWTEFPVGNEVGGHQFFTVHQKVLSVELEGEYYKIIFDGDAFVGNDIIGYNIDDDLNGNYAKIEDVKDGAAYISKACTPPNKYDTVYLVGSTSNKSRQCVMVLHKYNGAMVLSQFLNISLDNINQNYFFRLGQHGVNSWKVYGENVYFKGTFIDENGRNLSDLVTLYQTTVDTSLSGLRQEFLGYNNLLSNPFFILNLDYWSTIDSANFFTLGGKWVLTNKSILSTKRYGAFIIEEDGLKTLRIAHGYITQKNENLKAVTNLDEEINPYYVTVTFSCKPVTAGTVTVSIVDEDASVGYTEAPTAVKATASLKQDNKYGIFKASFLWNGTGDFKLAYTGVLKIQALVVKVNEIKNFELKYKDIFDNKDTLVEMINIYKNATT